VGSAASGLRYLLRSAKKLFGAVTVGLTVGGLTLAGACEQRPVASVGRVTPGNPPGQFWALVRWAMLDRRRTVSVAHRKKKKELHLLQVRALSISGSAQHEQPPRGAIDTTDLGVTNHANETRVSSMTTEDSAGTLSEAWGRRVQTHADAIGPVERTEVPWAVDTIVDITVRA